MVAVISAASRSTSSASPPLTGALLAPTLGQHLRELGRHRSNASPTDVLQPDLDPAGNLIGITVDRSTQRLQIARPDMSHREFRAVLDAFLSSWISSKGPYVEKFEEGFARFAGARHGIAVSNGTVALHLALVALGIGPGDEVIVPDLTFAATINAVLYCGATPVIVDVDERTWCLSLATVEAACTPRTKAIIPVHLYGRPAEMGPICAFAACRGIAVVEDCAEAPGARYAGRPVGQFGDVSLLLVLRQQDRHDRRRRHVRHQLARASQRAAHAARPRHVARARLLARPDRLQLPPHQHPGIDRPRPARRARRETLRRNHDIAEAYRTALHGIPGVRFPPDMDDLCAPVVWLTSVKVPAERRDELMAAALRADIETASILPFAVDPAALPALCAALSEQPRTLRHRREPSDVARR